MKKRVFYSMVTLLVIILFIFACRFERTYKRKNCQIMEISNDLITVKDLQNNLWVFKGTGFNVTDKVTLTMDTNNTDNNINDDIIIDVMKRQ